MKNPTVSLAVLVENLLIKLDICEHISNSIMRREMKKSVRIAINFLKVKDPFNVIFKQDMKEKELIPAMFVVKHLQLN